MERNSTVTFQEVITWEPGEEEAARKAIAAFNKVYDPKKGWAVREHSPDGLPRHMKLTATRPINFSDIKEES